MLDFFLRLLKDELGKPSLTNIATVYAMILSTIVLIVDFFYGYPPAANFAETIITTILGSRVAKGVINYGIASVYNSPKGENPKDGGTQ